MLLLLLLLTRSIAAAEVELTTAHEHRLRGRYDEALAAYQKLAERHPVAAALGHAQCLEETGRRDEAKKLLTAAAEKHARSAPLQARLAHLAFGRGDYEAARRHVDATVEFDKQSLPARWLDAELHRVQGRISKAQKGYEWFIDYHNARKEIEDPDAIRLIALAAAQYARWTRNHGQFRFIVNRLLPQALEKNGAYWPARLTSALLFLEKYNQRDALTDLNAAAAINPRSAAVLCGQAALALQNYELDSAERNIRRALAIDAENVRAHQLQADLLLADFRPREALAVLESARKLNPRDEATLGRLAAAYQIVDPPDQAAAAETRAARLRRQVLTHNGHSGHFFAAKGDALERLRRYPAAAVEYRAAIKHLPQLVGVRSKLGLIHMRLADEEAGAKLLSAAMDSDPFNVRTSNMLKVLRVLKDYQTIETPHFVIKFDPLKDRRLARYAAEYLEEEVYPQVTRRLGYEPQGKTLIEFFHHHGRARAHSWFSARMVGLPYVGTVAACAGRVVALTSPTATRETYDWPRVLKHEFVHVVNLQQTDFNIPHWLTEGLAVHVEGLPRPADWNDVLRRRSKSGGLFDLTTINRGFIRPRSGDDWTLAYLQAEIYVDYMRKRFGDAAIGKLLAAYAGNLETPAAIKKAFSVEVADFESGYRDYLGRIAERLDAGRMPKVDDLKTETARATKTPQDAQAAARAALAALAARDDAAAEKWSEKTLQLDAENATARYVVARLALRNRKPQEFEAAMKGLLASDTPPRQAILDVAAFYRRKRDWSAARRTYLRGRELYGHDVRFLKGLALVALKQKDATKIEKRLAELADVEPQKPHYAAKLAELAFARGDHRAAVRWARRRVWLELGDAAAHAVLGKAYIAARQFEPAAGELEIALAAKPKEPAWQLALAEVYVELGKIDEARALAEQLKSRGYRSDAVEQLMKRIATPPAKARSRE